MENTGKLESISSDCKSSIYIGVQIFRMTSNLSVTGSILPLFYCLPAHLEITHYDVAKAMTYSKS